VKKKLIFAFVLALMLCLLLIPSAFASDVTDPTGVDVGIGSGASATVSATTDDGTDATIKVNGSVQDVIDNSQNDDKVNDTYTVNNGENNPTVVELEDSVVEDIIIRDNDNVILDTNGKSITGSSGATITIEEGGTLTLTGNGTIIASETNINSYYSIVCSGNLILDGITINGTNAGTILCKDGGTITIKDNAANVFNAGNTDLINSAGGTVNIYGGTYNGNWSVGTESAGSTINIYPGNYNYKDDVHYSIAIVGALNGGVINLYGGNVGAVVAANGGTLNISGGTVAGSVYVDSTSTLRISGGSFYAGNIYDDYDGISKVVSPYLVDGKLSEEADENGFYKFIANPKAVVAPVVETAETLIPAVEAKAAEIIATVADNNTNYSIASNKEFTIQLSFSDESETNRLPEVISVTINGVEVEFTVAADGSIVLSPEVLAALGPGTHVITIMTADGPVTMTIVITD
jgi:hypothetical protein